MEEIHSVLVDLRALEASQDAGTGSYDDSTTAKALECIDRVFQSNASPDSDDISTIFTLLRVILTSAYRGDVMNEKVLRSWKVLGGLVSSHKDHMNSSLGLMDVATILIAYCTEGIDVLNIVPSTINSSCDSFVENHRSTVKLLWFFSQRILELLTCDRDILTVTQQHCCLVTLLRFIGVLTIVDQYSPSFSQVSSLCVERFTALLIGSSSLLTEIFNAINAQYNCLKYETYVGSCKLSLYLLQEDCFISSRDRVRLFSVIHLFLVSSSALSLEHTGMMDDSVLIKLMQSGLESFAHKVSVAENSYEIDFLMTGLLNCCCTKIGGEEVRYMGRYFLSGVLALFEESEQLSLVVGLWRIVEKFLRSSTNDQISVQNVCRSIKAVLLAVEPFVAEWLLQEIFICTGCIVSRAGTNPPWRATIEQSESLLGALPLSQVTCSVGTDMRSTIEKILEKCMNSIEFTAKQRTVSSSGELEQVELKVGCALALLKAAATSEHSMNSVTSSSQATDERVDEVWKEIINRLVGSADLGTTFLRWISALSEHVKTLIVSSKSDFSASIGDSSVRVSELRFVRAISLLQTLHILVQCFTQHPTVPRAVQAILAKSAVSCMEAATVLLPCSSSVSLELSDRDSNEERCLQAIVTYVAATLKIIACRSFSDKNLPVVKQVFSVWTTIAIASQTSTGLAQPWKVLSLLLSSLQSFANAMPPPLRPRARELVTPELALVMQARAQGKTFSLLNKMDVRCLPVDEIEVFTKFHRKEKLFTFLRECVRDIHSNNIFVDSSSDTSTSLKRSRQDFQEETEGCSMLKQVYLNNELICVEDLLKIVAAGSSTAIPVLQCTSATAPNEHDCARTNSIKNRVPNISLLLINAEMLHDIQEDSKEGLSTQVAVMATAITKEGHIERSTLGKRKPRYEINRRDATSHVEERLSCSNDSTNTLTQ